MSESLQSKEPRRLHSNMRAVSSYVIIAIAAAAVTALARNVLLDPIIDVGRDMYVADRLAHGARLYRDLKYNYPPLAPYLLALFLRFGGSSLAVVEAFNIVIALCTAGAIHRVTRFVYGARAALLAALLFVALSLAGATTFNSSFLMPYSVAATVGMFALILFADAIVRRVASPTLTNALAVAASATMASWAKQEYAVAVVITFGVAAMIHRSFRRTFVAFTLLNLVLFGAAAIYFADARPGHHWLRDNIANPALTNSAAAAEFYGIVRGGGEALGRNLALLAASAALTLLLFHLLRRLGSAGRGATRLLILVAAAVVQLLLAAFFFRGAPLLLLVVIAVAARRRRESPTLLLALLALMSLLRIPLASSPAWYGFTLVVPCYILAAGFFLGENDVVPPLERNTALLSLPLFAFVCGIALLQQGYVYWRAENVVKTPRGTFRDPIADRAFVLNDVTTWLSRSGARTMVVFPEGVTLNFLTGLRSPLSYYLFTPIETADPHIEIPILEEMENDMPDLVTVVSRDVSEFGSQGFGIDYDQRLMRYVRSNYTVAHQVERESFGAVIFRRNASGAR